MFFHTNLKFLYKKKGYTQETLANELNIKNTTVSTWVLGNSKPNVDTLLQLREILGVNLDSLFFKDFTDKIESENTDRLEKAHKSNLAEEPVTGYEVSKIKEVTIYLEKDCHLTGGKCAFDLLPELRAENEQLKKHIEKLEKNK